MSPNLLFGSFTGETPGEMSVDTKRDEQGFSQGPSKNEEHLSRPPPADLADIKGTEFSPLNGNHAGAETREVRLKGITDSSCSLDGVRNSLKNVQENLEGRRRPVGMRRLPLPTTTAAPENLNPPASRDDTAVLNLNVRQVRANLGGRLSAISKEALKLSRELKTVSLQCERGLEEQKRLASEKEKEVSLLQNENQKLRERIAEPNSTLEAVEIDDTVREIKTMMGQFAHKVNNLPSFRDKVLEIQMGTTCGERRRDKLGLDEDLRKHQIQLESALQEINFKTCEVEQSKETIGRLEEANNKLQHRNEMIQQQLCKQKAGQHGSYIDGQQTPSLLETTAKDMFSSIGTFSSLLSKYTDSNGYSTAHSFILGRYPVNRVYLARQHHWTYLLKEFICAQLFENFQSERFPNYEIAVMFLGPEERVSKCFGYFKDWKDTEVWDRAICPSNNEILDYLFVEYLTSKFHGLLPWDIVLVLGEVVMNHDVHVWDSLRQRVQFLIPEKRKLVESLMVAAGKVWQFHKLCLSFEPPVTIFRVTNGYSFNPDYMESIDELENHDDRNYIPKVAFMTYPGFRLRKSIIKCQVYLAIER